MGLFACREKELSRGLVVQQYTPGLSLRLGGADRGFSLGLRRSEEYLPEIHVTSDPDVMCRAVERLLRRPDFADGEPSSWGGFYRYSPPGAEAVAVGTWNLGGEVQVYPGGSVVGVGLTASTFLTGPALRDHVALVYDRSGSPRRESLVLWQLVPSTREESP